MPTPIFDAEKHAYRTHSGATGRALPSVTQVLSGVGIIDQRWFDEESAWRGQAIHKTLELEDKGTLGKYDPQVQPYLDGWREWKHAIGFKATRIEEPLFHETLFYAGTLDRADPQMVIDLKTGATQKWHPLQLAAYANLLPRSRTLRRFTVRLEATGRYKMTEYPPSEASRDFAVFQSALNVHNWRNNGN